MITNKDLTGKRFGRLLVLNVDRKTGRKKYYLCVCDCGSKKSVRSDCLTRGIIKSCKCLQSECSKERALTHGESKTPFYKTWIRIHDRCKTHQWYVSNGITVCERWGRYENFRDDMLGSYKPGLTIDRINNDLGYSPENCRWTTNLEQARNKTTNKLTNDIVKYIRQKEQDGLTVKEISKRIGVSYVTVLDAARYRTWANV